MDKIAHLPGKWYLVLEDGFIQVAEPILSLSNRKVLWTDSLGSESNRSSILV